MDPDSDEWTTFVTVPERSISPSTAVPLHVQEVSYDDSADTFTQHIMKNNETEFITFEHTKVNESEDGTLFEMDLEPYEIKASCGDTITVDSSTSTNNDEILEESTARTDITSSECTAVSEHDQRMLHKTEAISKHVLR